MSASSEYLNYSLKAKLAGEPGPATTPGKEGGELPKLRETSAVEPGSRVPESALVALRSKSVGITPVQNPNGSISYRVMGTIRPKAKQRKKHFANLEDALSTQALWEHERMQHAASVRPKITRLTQAELVQAETAVEFLRDSGFTLMDAARHLIRNTPAAPTETRTIQTAHDAFLIERKPFVGPRHHQSLRTTGEQFIRHVGRDCDLAEITTEEILRWLRSKGKIMKKSWNNYRADLFAFFAWCEGRPRLWLKENPVAPVPQHKIVRSLPQRLEIETVQSLMRFLEENHPDWCVCFVLALFLGIRPDRATGELSKFAAGVARDGVEKFFCNGIVHIPAEVSKDQRPRQTSVPANVVKWFEVYKVTPKSICPDDRSIYQVIRERFKIPHDGLRHTAISAHVSLHGSFAEAASQFGNSESMIRTHYFNRMSKAEAEAFYSVVPSIGLSRCC